MGPVEDPVSGTTQGPFFLDGGYTFFNDIASPGNITAGVSKIKRNTIF
mgnify:CR=1